MKCTLGSFKYAPKEKFQTILGLVSGFTVLTKYYTVIYCVLAESYLSV